MTDGKRMSAIEVLLVARRVDRAWAGVGCSTSRGRIAGTHWRQACTRCTRFCTHKYYIDEVYDAVTRLADRANLARVSVEIR